MLKPLAISSSLAAILLLAGCGTEAAKSSASISAPTTQKESINKQIVTRSIEAGEPLELTLPDASEYQSIEWRDETGKLLSTDPDINRLFTEAGEYRIYLTVTDKQNRVKTSTVVVKVTRHNTTQQTVPNKKPVVKAKAEAVDIMDEEYIHLSDDGSYDPDGTIVKYEWRDMDGILLSSTKRLDRMLHYDPQYDFNHDGTTRYVKTLYVTDDKGATSSKSFEIIVHKKPAANKAPTVDAGADKTITEGESVTLTATASDPDGTIQSYEWKEGSVVKGNSATLTLNNLSKGVHIFTMTVTDDKGATASDTVRVKVKPKPVENHPPVADDKSIKTNEGAVHAVTLSGSDADGDTLTYTVVTQPAHGSLIGTVPNLTYVPYSGFYGTDSFTYKVNDGKADSSVATVTITVVKLPDMNRAPVANGQSVTTNEDTPKTITLTGTDPDGDALTYTVTAQPAHGTLSGTAPNLTYTPAANYNGSDSFSFKVNDGKADSAPATVNITIVENQITVGQAILGPISNGDFRIEKVDNQTVLAEGKTTIGDGHDVSTAGLIQVPESVQKEIASGYYLVTVTGGKDIDTDDNNVWDTTPTPNEGALHALLTDEQIKRGSFKVSVLTEVVYQFLKEVLAGGNLDKDVLQQAISERTKILLKDVVDGGDVDGDGDIDSDDLIKWNPATDQQKLRLDFNQNFVPLINKVLTNQEIYNDVPKLFVQLNNQPIAQAQSLTMDEDTVLDILLFGQDADGDTLTYSIVTQPVHGILSGTAPNVRYIPAANYYGTDSFSFKVNDGKVDSAPVTVSITVNDVAEPKPSVDAGSNQKVARGENFILQGKAYNVDENSIRYIWRDAISGEILSREKSFVSQNALVDLSYRIEPLRILLTVVDSNGLVASDYVTIVFDDGDDQFEFDTEDNLISMITYRHGHAIYKRIFTYDSYGRLLTQQGDYDMDDIMNYVSKFSYDEFGNLKSQSRIWSDEPNQRFDIDVLHIYEYDKYGNRIKDKEDYRNDGTIDSITTYKYNDNGKIIRTEYDYDNDGIIDSRRIIAYHTNGSVAIERNEFDWNDDGTIDSLTIMTFDENGQRTKLESDDDADGSIDHTTTYSYESNGNITEREARDQDDDENVAIV